MPRQVPRTPGPVQPRTFTASRPLAAVFVYDDAGTGDLLLTGSAAEARAAGDATSGGVGLTGATAEARSASDSATGTVGLTGTAAESRAAADARSGTVLLSGSGADQWGFIFSDARSGAIALAGTGADALTHTASVAGTVAITGTRSDSRAAADATMGTVTLSGTAADSRTGQDARGGALPLSGTASESWSAAGVFTDSATGTIPISGYSVKPSPVLELPLRAVPLDCGSTTSRLDQSEAEARSAGSVAEHVGGRSSASVLGGGSRSVPI